MSTLKNLSEIRELISDIYVRTKEFLPKNRSRVTNLSVYMYLNLDIWHLNDEMSFQLLYLTLAEGLEIFYSVPEKNNIISKCCQFI